MLGINRKLEELERSGELIKVGLVGAGQMGRGMISQIESMAGMRVVITADIQIDNVTNAYVKAGVDAKQIVVTSEEKKAAGEIANTLRQIADKIDDGTLILKQGSEEITLEFPKSMVLELKIEEEQGKRLKKSFEIELEWVIGEEKADGATIL